MPAIETGAVTANSELIEVPEAGHWPWLESPDLVETMIRFITNDEGFRAP